MNALTHLSVSTQAAAQAGAGADTHTLVHVFLRGGADTLNIVVPFADDHYYKARPTLGLKQSTLIKLNDHYGFHPAMQPLESAFKEGRMGMLQGVGTDNTSGSHFECQDQMEHGDSMESPPAGGGWLGRFLRARADQSQSSLSAIAIGTQLPESLRGAPSVSVLQRIEDIAIKAPSGDPKAAAAALSALYGADVTLLGQRGQQTLDLFRRISALHAGKDEPANGAQYPDRNYFADGLREIARLIKARVGLEVACIDLPGWDTHFFQGTDLGAGSHATNVKMLADGIAAFETDMRALRANYTIMITTEFGRRIYENASLGTDHGRGFCFMAIGDKVKGGKILGNWPVQAMDERNPLGPGGLAIDRDFRDVFSDVLRGAMNMDAEDLARIFPGAKRERTGLFA